MAVHLLNRQSVYFTDVDRVFTLPDVARSDPPPPPQKKKNTLTAFFQLYREDTFASNFLYVDLPRFYTWGTSSKTWKKRKRWEKIEGHDIHEAETISRVYTVSPRQGECFFFLRILLHTIKSPTSFDALKTVNGAIRKTFREACQLQGLLEDDNAWHPTMEEAPVSATPQS